MYVDLFSHFSVALHLLTSNEGVKFTEMTTLGPQISPTDPRTTAGDIHSVGSRQHTSRADQEITIHTDLSPRQRTDARESHQHCNRESLPWPIPLPSHPFP